MKKYVLGIANMNDFVDFIGWNNDSDWYETVMLDYIEENDDEEFVSGYEDGIIIYQYDTKEEAERERVDIQREFDLVISVYEVTKDEDDGCWYVSNVWERKER